MPAAIGEANLAATLAPNGQPNAGNWTANFTPSVIGIPLPAFECYHIVVDGGPPGSTFVVYVNNRKYDSVFPGYSTSWDPHQTMKLGKGDTVSFQWNTGAGTSAPDVWMYFQEPEPL